MKKLVILCLFLLVVVPAGADFTFYESFETGLNGWSDDAGIMTWTTAPGWDGVLQFTSATAYAQTRILLPNSYDGDWGRFGAGDQYIKWYSKNAVGYKTYNRYMVFISYSAGGASYSQWNKSTGTKTNTNWAATYVPFNADWTDAQAIANGWKNGGASYGGAGWAATVANVDNAHLLTYGGPTGYNAMFDAFTPGIPEPATMALLGGLGGLFLWKRRK